MRILVIEDEHKVADIIVRGLRAERFAVDVAYDGAKGWEMASVYDYNLIILDLMLPGIAGQEILRRLRRAKMEAPVLVLTARVSTAEKVETFEAGADDYLTKPLATHSSVLRVGDLEVDRLSQQVKRAGKKIDLTSKEYALLEYLASNAGRVLSRTMIIEHVWDQSFEGLTNIVDVYVRHLREKIDEDHSQKLLRTVRGVGYCVSDEAKA